MAESSPKPNALLDRLRRGIARIEGRHHPGSTRAPAVGRLARNLGAPPPSQHHQPGGGNVPPVDSPPGSVHLGIDGLTRLQRWEETRRRLEWLIEYASGSAAKARARSAEAGLDADAAAQTVEQLHESLRLHDASKPEPDPEVSP